MLVPQGWCLQSTPTFSTFRPPTSMILKALSLAQYAHIRGCERVGKPTYGLQRKEKDMLVKVEIIPNPSLFVLSCEYIPHSKPSKLGEVVFLVGFPPDNFYLSF